jgi:integrase
MKSDASVRTKRALGGGLYYRECDRKFFCLVRHEGKLRSRVIPAKNVTEAKKLLPAIKAALIEQAVPDKRNEVNALSKDLTLRELVDLFLAYQSDPATATVGPRTLELRTLIARKHVVPWFENLSNVKLARDIERRHAKLFLSDLKRKGFSGSHVRSIITTLSAVLDHGVEELEILDVNVAKRLPGQPSGKRQTEPRHLTKDEVRILFENLSPTFRIIAEVLFYGGLRASEALALRWRDLDFGRGVIDVRTAATKTTASKSEVPMLPVLRDALRAHRQAQLGFGLHRVNADALVFTTLSGRPQSRRNLLRAINVASKNAGLWNDEDGREPVGAHDLRHSLASYAFESKLTLPQVSRLLRHANPNITATFYADLAGNAVETLRESLTGLSEVATG